MRISLIFIVLFLARVPLFSQNRDTQSLKDLAYVEVGGQGLFASVNYERQLSKEPDLGLFVLDWVYTVKATCI
jgi:hypothetical protein